MSENPDPAAQDDIDALPATEQTPRDRHYHGKMPPRLNDDALQHRVEQERVELGLDDYDPDEVPDAEA